MQGHLLLPLRLRVDWRLKNGVKLVATQAFAQREAHASCERRRMPAF